MKTTKGPWGVTRYSGGLSFDGPPTLISLVERCVDEPGMPLPVPMTEGNLELIAGACNACMKIDPEDPQRVADWLFSSSDLLRIGYEHGVGMKKKEAQAKRIARKPADLIVEVKPLTHGSANEVHAFSISLFGYQVRCVLKGRQKSAEKAEKDAIVAVLTPFILAELEGGKSE